MSATARLAHGVVVGFRYTVYDIEIITRRSRAYIYRDIKAGKLKTFKQGKNRFCTGEALNEYLAADVVVADTAVTP